MNARMKPIIVGGSLAAVLTGGCVSLQTPGQRSSQEQRERQLVNEVAVLRQEARRHVADVASIRADLQILLDNQRRLAATAEEAYQANDRQTKQIQQLSTLLSALETRLASADSTWRQQMERFNTDLAQAEKQRRKSMNEVISVVSTKIADIAKKLQRDSTSTTNQGTYTVEAGDTLSAIAPAFGVTINSLIKANGLKNTTIRIGQKLVIPAK